MQLLLARSLIAMANSLGLLRIINTPARGIGKSNPTQPLVLFERLKWREAKGHVLLNKTRQNQRGTGPGNSIELSMNCVEDECADIGNHEIRHAIAYRLRASQEHRARRMPPRRGYRIAMNIAPENLACALGESRPETEFPSRNLYRTLYRPV
jgi:hypothetical protein